MNYRLKRFRFIGIDANPEYLRQAENNLRNNSNLDYRALERLKRRVREKF